MNIFILDTDNAFAADYHCDQHINKMILESAQMLSTAAYKHFPQLSKHVYKPAYINHPATLWTCESYDNMWWLSHLAIYLEEIRLDHSSNGHNSIIIIKRIQDHIEPLCSRMPTDHVFCGPAHIGLRTNISIVQKYREYYRYKHRQWLLDKGRGMTYKNRPVPEFVADLITTR
jgi:hypothetical protein